jgi:catechol 2,3-dioxygenase-like lactoylglutathione lyase family enzyme/uncharacterized protein YciI
MRFGLFLLALVVLYSSIRAQEAPRSGIAPIRSIAIRCANLEKMKGFYAEALGGRFRVVQASGLRCYFGDVNGMTLKRVPQREQADFERSPTHQLGFAVADVTGTIKLALKHGGKLEGQANEEHCSVRDPDGNTIELYRAVAMPKPAKGKQFLTVYDPGPSWVEGKPVFQQPGIGDHAKYHQGLWREGKLIRSGPFMDGSGGATVLVAPSKEEAQKLIDSDPGIKSGVMKSGLLKAWFPVDWARFK